MCRLNFGIAVEQAKSEGLQVELVVVADDCAVAGWAGWHAFTWLT